MKKSYVILIILFLFTLFSFKVNDWGFFGHRKINRMAVFTLPSDMLPLYKKYITYLEEHSVDPDKRRYATKHEAVRHYIDLDQWGKYPFENVPRDFTDAISFNSAYTLVSNNDTANLIVKKIGKRVVGINNSDTLFNVTDKMYKRFFGQQIMNIYYEDEWQVSSDSINQYLNTNFPISTLIVKDTFSLHGVLPYYLPIALGKLTRAFEDKDLDKILRQSAEIGHYIGDAHVPLHTTKNYNGQLTDQVGIHAFWESRLPELFSEDEYDFFVGKANYIEKPKDFFWDIVLESHTHLNDVLNIEKELSKTFPSDRQWCYDERLGQSIKIQCKEYSKAYHEAMKGMVEERMTKAIHAIGSIWYTAWIDGGQPNLRELIKTKKDFKLTEEAIKADPTIKTREHDN